MAKKKATSMDVAREAGVSQATVSMILNKKYNVSFSKETIRQVTEAAEKLDYHLPKQRIRRSAKSRKLLVVFCPTLTNPYYVMLLQGIEAMLGCDCTQKVLPRTPAVLVYGILGKGLNRIYRGQNISGTILCYGWKNNSLVPMSKDLQAEMLDRLKEMEVRA